MSCNRCNRKAIRRNARQNGNAEPVAESVAESVSKTSSPPCRRPDDANGENVITDSFYCCGAPGSITRQLYSGPESDILISACYDEDGRSYRNADNRCTYWPSFAHPRWLSCEELYNKRATRAQRTARYRPDR